MTAVVLRCFSLWLAVKSHRAPISQPIRTKSKPVVRHKTCPGCLCHNRFPVLGCMHFIQRSDYFIALLFVEKRPFECCFVNVANEFHRQFDAMTPSGQE